MTETHETIQDLRAAAVVAYYRGEYAEERRLLEEAARLEAKTS
jgi:hypothetical protein